MILRLAALRRYIPPAPESGIGSGSSPASIGILLTVIMTTLTPFRIPVADLVRRPGASRPAHIEATLSNLGVIGSNVPSDEPITADLTLEQVSEGIVVRGEITAPWTSSCSRCLTPVRGTATVHVDELYERNPLEGETYPLEDDIVDLELLVRDALLLELPKVPLCRDDCQGLCASCGVDRNTTTCACAHDEVDPRWDALRTLDL